MRIKLQKIFSKVIAGEWGDDAPEGNGVNIIRTTNFRKDGKIDFANIENRLIQKKINSGERRGEYITDVDKIEKKSLKDGDIIIEKSGGGVGVPVGRVVYFLRPDKQTYLSNNFTQVLRVNEEIAYSKYVYYHLKHFYFRGNVLKYQNQTTGIFNLKLERYLQEEIDLPSLDNQYSIAAQFDLIQEVYDKRLETLEAITTIQKSIFFEMFGDPVTNPHNYKTIKLTSPSFHVTSGITPSRKEDRYFNGDIVWVKSTDINKQMILDSEEHISTQAINETNVKIFPKGSVLIAMYGQGATRGKVALLGVDASTNQACAVIQPKEMSNVFLYSCLHYSYEYLRSLSKGGNRDNLSLAELKKVSIIEPDKRAQLRFEKIFYLIKDLEDYIKKSSNLLGQLSQYLLQNVFKSKKEIDEEPIFKDLIKKLSVEDLKGNKKRLTYLLKLFEDNKFENNEDYMSAKDKLFNLILADEVEQKLQNDKITLQPK